MSKCLTLSWLQMQLFALLCISHTCISKIIVIFLLYTIKFLLYLIIVLIINQKSVHAIDFVETIDQNCDLKL